MPIVYSKTDVGQREIRERTQNLSRPARTMLVLADGTRTQEQLLQMVQGASAEDFAGLLTAGMLAASGGGAPAGPAPKFEPTQPMTVEAVAAAPADEPSEGLPYRELYDSLNALAKEQLGLFRGYKFVLEVEKASGVEELRQVAVRFVDEVQKVKGDSAAQMVRRALGLAR
jgi:hypothetical protein